MKDKKELAICLLVTNFDAPTGGVQQNSRLLVSQFCARGIESFVCTRNYYDLPRNETKDGIRIHRSPVFGQSLALASILYLADCLIWLIINREKFDVIHCQQMFGPTMVATLASFIINKPILTRITLAGETGEANAIRSLPFAGLRLKLLKRVSKWIALTQEMKEELELLHIPKEKIKIINNATEIPAEAAFDTKVKLEYRKKLDLRYDKLVVFTGRLSQEKGVDVLIRAWKIVSETFADAHLLLLGDGGNFRNVEMELKEQSSKLDLSDSVHFLGFVLNPKEFILASDSFVLPSNAEGMSNSLVEAFACGAAVIASNIESNKEICVDMENCLLVPVGDEDELAEAIIKLLTSPNLARRLSKAARAVAEERLSVDKMVTGYIDAYTEILSQN